MFSLRKTLLALGFLLGASQLFTVRSSVYFNFLVGFQSRRSKASTAPGDRRQYGAFLLSKAFLYLTIGTYCQSALTSAYLKFKGHSPLGHLTVDPLLALITAKYSAANVFFLTGLGLFGVFIFYLDYGLSLGLHPYLTNLISQLICENPKDIFKLNSHLAKVPPIRDLVLHPVKSFTQIRLVVSQLWNPSQQLTFAQSRLEGFPYLSGRTRSRLVLLTLIYENAFAGAALALVFIIGMVVIIVMLILCTGVSLPLAIAVFLDTLFLSLSSWHNAVILSFFHHALLLFTFLTRSHLKELNGMLAIILFQVEIQLKRRRFSNGNRLLIRQLNTFFTQHRSLATIQQSFNENMISRFYFIAFFFALFFQIVQLNILLLEDLKWEEKSVCLAFSVAETMVALQSFRLLISWTDSLYSSSRLLFQAQKILVRSANRFQYPTTVTSQLKLMTYIERLCTKKKVRFTVGPLGKISNRSLYEFFFAYSGFFIYITSLMRQMH